MSLFDAFLKIDGIKGESADAKHKGEIDVMSFSWGMAQTGVSATGGGGGAGKVQVHDFTINKRTDASSPLLMLNCANGTHIKTANFVIRKAGGEQMDYVKLTFSDVLISSYRPGSDVSFHDEYHKAGNEIPSEVVTLNFARIEFQYQPQGADGKAQGGPIMAGWDVKGNQKI